MEPEARLLRYFLAVADELNFTRAAETLGIAQPALSAQIRQLEAQLGVRLLERTTRYVRLTEAGAVVQERGPGALTALAGVWEEARRVGRGEAGRLRVAYSPSCAYETVPLLIEALRERHPDIAVAAGVLATSEIVGAVVAGKVDAGIARAPLETAGVRLRLIRRERQGVLVPASHPLAGCSEVALAAVAEHPVGLHRREDNPAHYDLVVSAFQDAGLSPRLVERPIAFDPTMRAVREGDGIAIVGVSSAVGLAGDLRWIPLAEPAPRLPIQLVLRDGEPSPVVDRFERVAVAAAAAAGWLTD
jgi:DNA-binding transcriptional LysR family regulator